MKKNYFLRTSFLLFIVGLVSLANAQEPELWGMTYKGGDHDLGTIFKTDVNGINHSVEYSFLQYYGSNPQNNRLLEADDGKLYGITRSGGSCASAGILFEYNPVTQEYIEKYCFGYGNSTSEGYSPEGGLVQAGNGKLYGTASEGGDNNKGVIFEYNLVTETYTKLFDFDGDNGYEPQWTMIEASNGKLYGTTYWGGSNNCGVLFEYNISTNTVSKKVDFNSTNGYPTNSLIEASNGKIYGGTRYGLMFEYTPATNYFNVVGGVSDPQNYQTSIMQADNNKLYGLTDDVIFEYDISSGGQSILYESNYPYLNGDDFVGTLTQANNGKLYGMTWNGGSEEGGVMFVYDITTDSFNKLYDFGHDANSLIGHRPTGSLMQAANGKIYGQTSDGGKTGAGILFEYNISTATLTKKIDFDVKTGDNPNGDILQATNGKLYGLTLDGGIGTNNGNGGILFEYDPIAHTYMIKHDFYDQGLYPPVGNGKVPYGSLMQANNGKIYGFTHFGGLNNGGVIFEFDPITSIYTKKYDFEESYTEPIGRLVQASNDKLYGITESKGAYNGGMIYEYDIEYDVFSVKYDFSHDAWPTPDLVEYNDKLYGATGHSGANNKGCIFEYNPLTNTYTEIYDFEYSNGLHASGIIISNDAKIYGISDYGGDYYKGGLYEYNIATGIFVNRFSFNVNNSYDLNGSHLTQASNGKLYGLTYEGGVYDEGIMFEFDLNTNTYTKKLDFDITNGANPWGSSLIELNSYSYIIEEACNSYTTPSGNQVYENSGIYNDTINDGNIITIYLTIYPIDISVTYSNNRLTANNDNASYQWLNCNNAMSIIAGATEQTFTPTESGSYAVEITDGACVDTSSCITTTIGVNEFSLNNSISIYPNPAHKFVLVQSEDLKIESIKVFDIWGKLLMTPPLQKTADGLSINVSGLRQGAYFIKVTTKRGIVANKLIIE